MLFGHNTNVEQAGTQFHVQTEDRGTATALIDTTVYCRGRVVHRRTHNYFDLLPLDEARSVELKQRLDAQHRAIVEQIRSGDLLLSPPPAAPVPAAAPPVPPPALVLDLINARDWLKGKRATLQIAVKHRDGQAVAFAKVKVRVDGAASPAEFSAETGLHGRAEIAFDMPKLAAAEPSIVIEATEGANMGGASPGHLRFHLKAKPRVPAV